MSVIPVIIPAYEPDERLIKLLKEIIRENISPVIVVNDGSGNEYDPIFDNVKSLISNSGGVVLVHDVNRGKGRALKTAFGYVINTYKDCLGCVTADSDGQHTVESIKAIITAMHEQPKNLILGVRKFDTDTVPWKSRFGNAITEKIFKYITGERITDTQTGLRGIPIDYINEVIELEGERFEYEIRMLLDAAGKIAITEIPIETIYDSKDNHQTHFNPIKDSFRIYRILLERFIKYAMVSVSSCILDVLLFWILCKLINDNENKGYLIYATIGARFVSAIFNYVLNYKIVFESKETVRNSLKKYIFLAITQGCLSAFSVWGFERLFQMENDVLVKVFVDTVLFFVSFIVQRTFVFKKN